MTGNTMALMAFAELTLEARACSVAILAEDFDEARFRAIIVVAKVRKFGQPEVARHAAAVAHTLGPAANPTGDGCGGHILALAKALDAIRPEGVERDDPPGL